MPGGIALAGRIDPIEAFEEAPPLDLGKDVADRTPQKNASTGELHIGATHELDDVLRAAKERKEAGSLFEDREEGTAPFGGRRTAARVPADRRPLRARALCVGRNLPHPNARRPWSRKRYGAAGFPATRSSRL